MAQKSRSELQGLFKTGAKPSQDDFTDFIESTLNIKDDGIEKPFGAGTPLKITAQGEDEKLLDFYAGDESTWSISLKSQDNLGFNISNLGGSKLFIDSINGNLGLSIDKPSAKLHIQQTGNEDALRIDDHLKDSTPLLINKDGNVGVGGRLKWTKRFIAISMQRGATFPSGHININQPTQDIPANNVFDGKARSVNAEGVILNGWEALYAVHTIGGDENAVSYHIVKYANTFEAPSNWLLVAVVNNDDQSIKLGTGLILNKNTSSTNSSPIPVSVIMMWYGQVANIPDGWALCNGTNGTPDLQDRFIVAAGKSYNPGDLGEPDQHRHSVNPPSTSLNINSAGNHTHKFPGDWYKRDFRNGGYSGIDTSGDNIKLKTTQSSGNHHHTGTVDIGSFNSASSSGLSRPKWYALCFIMKL